MIKLHSTQVLLLQRLMYSEGLRFSQLKLKDDESNKLAFHLEELIKNSLIIKVDNLYKLSEKGKELAGRMDLGDDVVKNQAKVSVVLVCVESANQKERYLLYTRHKSPFYKFQGFPTGKVKSGETIIVAARRELKEETNLMGKPKIVGILHSKIHNRNQELLEDKIFFVCRFQNPKGKLVDGPEGKYRWVTRSEIGKYLQNPVQEIKDIFKILNKDKVLILEKNYTVDNF